ncbi:hypothetical protein FA13DRAFT_1723520 [Coprinellus micaceus]|uniref:Uncharacterized protein n=1 Tax=Coprinellus micaceus TaxID=71717 RepID=A0A4Y7R5R0_COPMI|nr:hypothetical protein FA13DRAFT_1723520 [Coprinellus micaceus]
MSNRPVSPRSSKENVPPAVANVVNVRKRPSDVENPGALNWGPPQKQSVNHSDIACARTDPLVGHGRHFGRTIRTFCRIHTLITNGLSRTMQLELGRIAEEDLTRVANPFSPTIFSDLAEQRLYSSLLKLSPGLEERLNTGSAQDLHYVADMITKGISSARSDDTKSIKTAIVDWITPSKQVLSPPIQRNVKDNRGFHHPRTGELLCPVNFDWKDEKVRRDLASGHLVPSGDVWPRFLYRYFEYDPKDPWNGLLRSSLLVMAYKHIFTSPSSVHGGASKATRSSNARIHGMTSVTVASLAYVATQVRFALSDSPSFCRTDLITDSEYFYNLVVDLLEDENERTEVGDLLQWWNQTTDFRQIFPAQINHSRSVHGDSVIAKIRERRRLIDEGLWVAPQSKNGTASSSSSTGGA